MNPTERQPVRLAYIVSHPIQYQAPLLRRIAQEPDIDLTVLFASDFSVRAYKDKGFGVEMKWDVPLLEGYKSEFPKPWRDKGGVSATTPVSRGLFRRMQNTDGTPAFDAMWVHGYSSINAILAILAAKSLGIPVIVRAEPWLGDRTRAGWKLAGKKLYFRALSHAVDAVLPIGTRNSQYWHYYFGESVPQFLMPYAVDNGYFAKLAADAAPRQAELRAELNLQPGRPVILFASKLQTRKHAGHLVEAYREFIANKFGNALPYLVIVGDGEERANLEAYCTTHNLADVRFAGFRNQSELPRFFELADVFVLPSRHEAWGLIVNESMASGCPVIVSTDVGAQTDLVTDGIEGCVFPVGDVGALRHCLERVFATPLTAAAMGEAACQRMESWGFEEDVQGLRQALAWTTRKLKF